MNYFKIFVAISILLLGLIAAQPISTPVKSRDWYGKVDYSIYNKEKNCLVSALYHEARGESEEGLRAVLSVIKNRKNTQGFADTFCGVVKQPYQFSYLNKSKDMSVKPVKALDKERHRQISYLADEALLGHFKPTLGPSVLYYTRVDVKKPWMKKVKLVAVIDNHKFFSI